MARAPRVFSFKVTGSGPFPIDMLRYDECFPCSESNDSSAITHSFERGNRGAYTVQLISASQRGEPTRGRWESFGFKVEVVR